MIHTLEALCHEMSRNNCPFQNLVNPSLSSGKREKKTKGIQTCFRFLKMTLKLATGQTCSRELKLEEWNDFKKIPPLPSKLKFRTNPHLHLIGSQKYQHVGSQSFGLANNILRTIQIVITHKHSLPWSQIEDKSS